MVSLAALACCGPTPSNEKEEDPIVDDDDESEEPDMEEPPMPPDPGMTIPLVPGCTASTTLAGITTWLHFVRPDAPCSGAPGSGNDYNVIVELIRLIDSAPGGSRIDGHIYNITIDAVAEALLNAQSRGVDVRISTDGQIASSVDTSKTQFLDQLAGIVYCNSATSNACVSTATDAISHTKLFVFSATATPDNMMKDHVVWFGSPNPTLTSGVKTYNNAVTIYGDAPLYTSLQGYLDDLLARNRYADYYDPTSGRGHLLTVPADVYVSPEATTDLVLNRLDDVTPDANCVVHVMHASVRDTRMAVVDRLIAMKQGGCDVRIVADTVEPDVLSKLRSAGVPMRKNLIHDKVFVVFGKFGTAYEHRVYTGSHNLSGSSNAKYDEIFVKLAAETPTSHPVYDEYSTHFEDAYNSGTPL
jgi:phosphatidylserine/phosphatidylglycerophosphate/cardiolipin synthase-like enzyme